MTESTEKLRILAQPKAFYRERYCSETDPTKHRAQRFIRADDETSKHEYPTVQVRIYIHTNLKYSPNIFKQIPSKWRDLNRNLYIRVTLVTSSEHIPVVCIHPYAIDTHENDILRDPYHNSLYFPITKEEIHAGEKRYRKIFFFFQTNH